MILVTVGTTRPFDALIEAIDRLVGKGEINDRVVCQIGNGSYFPKHCEYFSFKPNLDQLIEEASLIIGHGGTGTVFTVLTAGKPFIAVSNPEMADDHQAEFLSHLGQVVSIVWTKDTNQLESLIDRARSIELRPQKRLSLMKDLRDYLSH